MAAFLSSDALPCRYGGAVVRVDCLKRLLIADRGLLPCLVSCRTPSGVLQWPNPLDMMHRDQGGNDVIRVAMFLKLDLISTTTSASKIPPLARRLDYLYTDEN